jgi:hypothetical protein
MGESRSASGTSSLAEHHVWLVGELLERAEALTEGQLAAPVEISVDGVTDLGAGYPMKWVAEPA